MKHSCLWGLLTCCLFGGLICMLAYSSQRTKYNLLAEKRLVVAALQLTDLSLCSEARYTRHPTQADLFSAFQDSPAAFEHFPTGSLIMPRLIGFSGRVEIQSTVAERE